MTAPVRPAWSERVRDLEGDVQWFQARAGLGTWRRTTPHRRTQLTLLGTVALCFVLIALFLGLISAGQRLMCITHDNALRYCPGYVAPVQP